MQQFEYGWLGDGRGDHHHGTSDDFHHIAFRSIPFVVAVVPTVNTDAVFHLERSVSSGGNDHVPFRVGGEGLIDGDADILERLLWRARVGVVSPGGDVVGLIPLSIDAIAVRIDAGQIRQIR